MPVDTGSLTHALPPKVGQTPALDVATAGSDICDEADAAEESEIVDVAESSVAPVGRFSWKRSMAYGVLPGLALILALGCGYLKWQTGSIALSQKAAVESVAAATESTVAMLSYRPDTAEKELPAAAERLTGKFRDEFSNLVHDVVIPGAKEKQISSIATVPAAASVAASADHAVVLVFVNQTTVIGNDPPTNSISSVRITLDKTHNRWLVSGFDPV